jgi:hypothetical protein
VANGYGIVYRSHMTTSGRKAHPLRTQILLSLFSAIIGGLISLGIVQLTRHQQTETEAQKAQAEAATVAG